MLAVSHRWPVLLHGPAGAGKTALISRLAQSHGRQGTDTRPPMLVESDYDSWKIRIHRYIRGKPNGKQIWKSIQNGPTPHPMITDPPPT
ncbi:retrovirus-related pol polyprotein from transposon TNT 1-94, partial [Tanacetum coccineum]